MYQPAELRERIAQLFSSGMHLDVPSPDLDLFDAGVLDSLAFVELLLQLEREFGVIASADDLELENFQSIARIADFVMARAPEAKPARVVSFAARG